MIKVVVDTLGGDNGASACIEGAVCALKEISDLEIILVGDKEVIQTKLSELGFSDDRISIEHAPDEISCNDKPTEAIRVKKESSLYKSFEILKTVEDANAMVSTGSTGAILAGAVLKIGRQPGVKRPAFCPILPTVTGGIVGICDSGANAESDEQQLTQFAIMGNLYLKTAYGIKNPRVALLNVGVEEEKGDTLRKTVYANLKNVEGLNFTGNMEARDLLKGVCDLVVCDGFSGNVLLKSHEGACMEVMKMLKKTLKKGFFNKIGALLLKKDLYKMKDFMDYNNYGGAVVLGTKKTIVKGHGSSKSKSIYICIKQAYNMEKNNLRSSIENSISVLNQNA